MSLYEFLTRPLAADPRLQQRLAKASTKNATNLRQAVLNLEFFLMASRPCVRQVDIFWAGHLPMAIAQDLGGTVRIGRFVLGRKDRSASLKLRHFYVPIAATSARLRESITRNQPIADSLLERQIRKIEKTLRQARPAVVVMTANYDPAMRLVALAAQRAHVAVALYGHGISTPSYYLDLDDGISSHFLCWYEEEGDEYVALGVDPSKVAVVGPLRSGGNSDVNQGQRDIDLLVLGTRAQGPDYASVLSQTVRRSSELGLRMAYRPHPLEDIRPILATVPGAHVLNLDEALGAHVARARWVVGGGSTALIEAKLEGAIVCYLHDLSSVSSPSIEAHLRRIADVVASCATFDVVDLDRDVVCKKIPYRSPAYQISLLLNDGWFST